MSIVPVLASVATREPQGFGMRASGVPSGWDATSRTFGTERVLSFFCASHLLFSNSKDGQMFVHTIQLVARALLAKRRVRQSAAC